ncbi:universal stress protein [Aquimarina sp. MMG015]|uniref:universal stress protein n=1 Tax=Aquimarina sp. MMG015 TaxID=2822689 RepID=UPI001B3A1466|nr:universal stress protein [Aquimarina sp. MMG015]MBQ4802955.1 universal stress protein [Aquimarina sp. MMG015]
MKKILVTTDFSNKAWNALVYILELYKNIPCELHILNTYDLNSAQLVTTISSQRVGNFYTSIKIMSEDRLKKTLEDIQNTKLSKNHTFQTVSKPGSLTKVLRQMTAQYKFDLILMGSKKVSNSKQLFLGSTVKRVLESEFNSPILIIPEDVIFKPINNIAFATNFERIYYKSEINPIIDLAKHNNATVKMVRVYDGSKLNTVQHYNTTTLEGFFRNVKFDFHMIPDSSNIEIGIQSFIEEQEIDLLAMITYKHNFIERLTREAVIKKITFHTKIPFLVIPADHI